MQKGLNPKTLFKFLTSYFLVLAIFAQSMVMAVAMAHQMALPVLTNSQFSKLVDPYGSFICTAQNSDDVAKKNADLQDSTTQSAENQRDNRDHAPLYQVPNCCLSGCILSVAARNFYPPNNFLTLDVRISEVLALEQTSAFHHFVYPSNNQPRAPPIFSMLDV